jgi:hypothetical protein
MKCTCLVLSALLLAIQLIAQSEMQTKSLSVFKNGKSFVIKEGSVKTTDNVYTLSKMPEALFGTLWFSAGQSKIKQVVSKMEKVNEPIERKAIGFRDLLYANKGKQLSIVTTDDKTYTGVVDDFELSEEVNSLMSLRQRELSQTYGTDIDYRLFPSEEQVILIKIDKKWISLNPLYIRTIEFSEKPESSVRLNIKAKKPIVKITFENGGNQLLRMMYLQNGISWTPIYLLKLDSDNEATLRLQAEVSNSVDDIINTDMNFVIGVPNFEFAKKPSILNSIIGKIAPEYAKDFGNFSQFSNSIMADRLVINPYDASNNGNSAEGIEGESAEDYYFYNVKNISLENGASAIYPLYSKPISIKHLYECNLNETNNSSDDNNRYGNYSFDIKKCEVYHSIEIKNNTTDPLTTGPVMIVDKTDRPLAQDLIKYTGAKQSSFVKLTQSPDISVEENGTVIDNKKDAKIVNTYSYDLVTIQNEIVIINSKKQSIDMSINKRFEGEIKDVSIKYDNKKSAEKRSINPTNNLNLRPTLKAGESIKITYTYETYIQN